MSAEAMDIAATAPAEPMNAVLAAMTPDDVAAEATEDRLATERMPPPGANVHFVAVCGNQVMVPECVARQSRMTRNLITDVGIDQLEAIPLSNVDMNNLLRAVVYMTRHANDPLDAPEVEPQNFVVPALEPRDAWLGRLDLASQIELLNVAYYMDIESLIATLVDVVAQRFRGKTPTEIRAMFGVHREFTPEEMEAVFAANEWAREPPATTA